MTTCTTHGRESCEDFYCRREQRTNNVGVVGIDPITGDPTIGLGSGLIIDTITGNLVDSYGVR